ncbi:MAG: histidine kinase [Saprospiraceae bacterium]|nr:histidine kinase [Saprospiraceae bacterium]
MSEAFKKFIRDFLIIGSIGGIVIVVTFANPFKLYERGGWELLWSYYWRGGIGTATIWLGNAYLSGLPDRWANWMEAPVRRLFWSVLLTVAFTTVAWVLLTWLFFSHRFGWDVGALVRSMDLEDFVPTMVITFLISIFMHGRAFLLGWKASLIEAERLKKEQISARYESLKNQVNPHFLFNSLNVLAALVHQDADRAEQFIRRLSLVYRYILDSRDRELVSVREELEILQAYLFLLEVRFGKNLELAVNLPADTPGCLAPLSLQMLVENAIKHNEVSKNKPLRIEIFEEDGRVVVRNILQSRNSLPESIGVGLANIRARYQLLSDADVSVSAGDGFFTVKLPILTTAGNAC